MLTIPVVVVQAKDKAHWQKLFSHFCSRTANEEEEIAHKLLGEQFRVSKPSLLLFFPFLEMLKLLRCRKCVKSGEFKDDIMLAHSHGSMSSANSPLTLALTPTDAADAFVVCYVKC